METPEVKDYSLASFDYVVVEKDKLLAKLKENRDRHDAIYQASVSGYWVQCQEKLDEKTAEFGKAIESVEKKFTLQRDEIVNGILGKDRPAIKDFYVGFTFGNHWSLPYPTNHIDDYQRVIDMLEFGVADKIQLTAQHFQAYVRNVWDWNGEFATSNLGYVKSITGALFANDIALYSGFCVSSGCAGNFVPDSVSNSSVYQFATKGAEYT